MSTVNRFRQLEGGEESYQEMYDRQLREKIAQRRAQGMDGATKVTTTIQERDPNMPSWLQNKSPEQLQAAIRSHALNRKIAKKYNEDKVRAFKRELERNLHPKVIDKTFYTVTKVGKTSVRVTNAHVESPFSMEPVITLHPGDSYYDVQDIEEDAAAEVDGQTYTRYTVKDGALAKKPEKTQQFWVAVSEDTYAKFLNAAINAEDMKRVRIQNMMALDHDSKDNKLLLKHVRAPLYDNMGNFTGEYKRLIRGDYLKRFLERKKDELKLSDAEKELHSLKALNDRMEKILMMVTKQRVKTVEKAKTFGTALDARTKTQLEELTKAFNHPLKMGSLYKPKKVENKDGDKDGEMAYFCDIRHTDHKKFEAKHGTVNETSSAYQMWGDREKKTNQHHKALLVDGVCVSPQVTLGEGRLPYAQERNPETYHHLSETNALTQKINARLDPTGIDYDKQMREEEVWANMVHCARAGDDEEYCKAEAKYPLSDTPVSRQETCEYTQLQRKVPRAMLQKIPENLQREDKVHARIFLGEKGYSNKHYPAVVKRIRKDNTLDLLFGENLSDRQKKMMPGRCQPKFIDADETTEASDLYHDKFYEKEKKYIKKSKASSKTSDNVDVQSILNLFRKLETQQKEKNQETEMPFDDSESLMTTDSQFVPGYHRV